MRRKHVVAALAAALAAACGEDAGVEGSSILLDYATMSRGVIFASQAIIDSKDYDLYWAPVPIAATIDPQPVLKVTDAEGDEWQPSVSRGGNGIAFARPGDGIFLINTSGRISRISETKDSAELRDSLPAVSFDGTKVAWVREQLKKPIGTSGFFETIVMVADFDGNNVRAAEPHPGLIQDAPVWEPRDGGAKLVWSEFDANSVGAIGPLTFGIYLHDLDDRTGRYLCRSPEVQIDNELGPRNWGYRCFGQHLAWPYPQFVVSTQDLIEIDLVTGALNTIWPQVVIGLQNGESGQPNLSANPQGFFPPFPISASYGDNRMIIDGVITPRDGDEETLAFYMADLDGGGIWRLPIDGFRADLDLAGTNNFLFSLATPQLVP